MSPGHTTRQGSKRYRYYVSRQDVPSPIAPWRIPAGDLESLVADKICEVLSNPERVHDIINSLSPSAQQIEAALARAAHLSGRLKSTEPAAAFGELVGRVEVTETTVQIRVNAGFLLHGVIANVSAVTPIELVAETKLARIGREMKLVVASPAAGKSPDPGLVKLVVKAFSARRSVEQNPGSTIADLAKAHGHGREYFGVLLRLSYLAPAIQVAIVEGRQPIELTRQQLARTAALPFDWLAQQQMLGVTANPHGS